MAGGDFAVYEKAYSNLIDEISKRPKEILNNSRPHDVSDEKGKKRAEIIRDRYKDDIAKNNKLIQRCVDLYSNIKLHLPELQVKEKNGKREYWETKMGNIQTKQNDLEAENIKYREFLKDS